jgi:hypothetical protein
MQKLSTKVDNNEYKINIMMNNEIIVEILWIQKKTWRRMWRMWRWMCLDVIKFGLSLAQWIS